MHVRLRPAADDALDAVAASLGLDRSNAIRFLVFEKARALGLPLPTGSNPPAPAPAPPRRGRR
jgi:antitoxin component of RelBE/YafQ-DinJ toxin-antitoxin module